MKKRVFLLVTGLVLVFIGVSINKTFNNEYAIIGDKEINVIKHEKSLSMMLETEAGSGNYEMTTRESWPTDGYVFNSNLSKCENGSELSWDNVNKSVLMSGNVSDKCYIYFDIALPYKITYPTFKYSTMSGITEAKAGEKVNITVNFGDAGCDGDYQIIGYPTSITDLSCNEEEKKWLYELENGKINTNINLTCQFSMPAENVEFTNIQDAGHCLL